MICTSCGKGCLSPKVTSSPVLVVKQEITQNEIKFDTVFVQSGKNKYGHDEHTTSYYLAKEMGMVGLQFNVFSLTNLYLHIPPKGGRKKEDRDIVQRCIDFSISELQKVAKDKKIIFMMGAETIKLFTGYNASSVYGLICKSDLLPDVPVIIPAPNSDKLMNQPIGELRNALGVLSEKIKIYKQYKET